MPSNANYVRDYKQELVTAKRRAKKNGDPTPNGTRAKSATNKLRKKLKLGVGNPKQAGHTSGKKLGAPAKGSTGGAGRAQSTASNSSDGGKSGSRAGKAAGARKGHKSRKKGT